MSDENEEELLLAKVVSAHRDVPRGGQLRHHPAWADLSLEGREKAHAIAMGLRAAEAALDPEGLSSAARAVLARIRGGG